MLPSFRSRRSGRSGDARAAAAAVVGEIAHQFVHVLEVRAVDHKAPVLAALRQSGPRQLSQVERQGCGRQIEQFADPPSGEAFGPGFYEKAENLEPRVLRESGKRFDRLRRFHISNIMEIRRLVNCDYCLTPVASIRPTLNTTFFSPACSKRSVTGTFSPSLNARLMSTNIRWATPGLSSRLPLAGRS